MTDRIACLNVILDGEYRTDDLEDLVAAIKQLRNVADVRLGPPVTSNDYMIEHRTRLDMYRDVINFAKSHILKP